jgi:DNA-binding response OmpR family regulator
MREIRRQAETPVIMITGKGELVDRVAGLETGADDYIAKPFHLREVLARVRSVLRRSAERAAAGAAASAPAPEPGAGEAGLLLFEGWRLDLGRRALHGPGGEPVELTTAEFNLLALFAGAPNRPLSRDQLMDGLKGQDWSPFDRSIDTQVGRLRKKIERDPRHPTLIKTVRGIGYVLAAKVQPA